MSTWQAILGDQQPSAGGVRQPALALCDHLAVIRVTGDEAAISRIFSCSRVCTRNAARFCSVLRLRNRAVGVNADMPPPPLPKLGSFRAPASHGAIGGSIPRGAGVSLSPSLCVFIDFASRDAIGATAEAWKPRVGPEGPARVSANDQSLHAL